MATANLTHRHIFGLKGNVKDNLHFIDENVVVYPAGHNTIVFNTEDKRQKFIHATDGSEGIVSIAVCPSRRFVAVAEKSDRGVVNVYDLKTLKKRKVLSTPESLSTVYVSMCFSQDNQLLLTQGGAPDWTLVCWNWAKAKPIASVKVSQGPPVTQCSFSPLDSAVVCVSGHEIFRFYRIVENAFRPMPQPSVELQHFPCHTWLKQPEDHVVLATQAGELLLFSSGEFLALLSCSPCTPGSVTAVASSSKGFITGSEDGTLNVFEPSEDVSAPASEMFTCTKTLSVEGGSKISTLAVSLSEDSLAFTTVTNQMYTMPLVNTDMLKAEEVELLSTSFHGPGSSGVSHITGLDTCIRKPLVVTCGLDKWVRVWNYLEKSTELSKKFAEEAHSVAFHPSGLHILVGFTDKLRLLNLLMEEIRPYKEFPIKMCRESRFSNGGQYFAAVNSNTITVYNTYTCEKLVDLRGHNGKVRSLYWMQDDYGLISAGMDGAIYQWDIEENKRELEFVQKGCHYSSALCTADGTSVFAVGSDRQLKEIEFPSATVPNEIECGVTLGQIVMSHSQRMLFGGTAEGDKPGCVRSYKFPISLDYTEYQCMSSPITRMRISHDDLFLFTADEDGCLCMFEVRDKEGRPAARTRETVQFAEEILVTKSDLEEKNTLMQELKNKVDELTLHNEYQLRLKDMNYNEKIKEVTEKFTQELEQDKNKFELLREEKNDMEMEFEERIKQMEEKHQHELQEIEANYQQKIMNEVERYQQLVHERDLQQERWEEQQSLLVSTHERYVAEVTEDFERRLDEDRQLRLQMEEDKSDLQREFDETKRQLEGDIDQEIEELKEKYESKLNAEREATLKYKGENGIMKKKFSALQKEIEDQRDEIKNLLETEKELYEQIKALEKEIQAHKREIRGRDDTIGEKEKRIYDLKKKNQELEKFKFVLDFKIKELKRQIEPRENEIADMKDQIKEMDQELEQFHKSNAQLDLMIGELRGRLDGMQREIMGQRTALGDQQGLITRFRNELHQCVQYIQDPRTLRESIARLYRKHVQTQVMTGELDVDIQREYHRQREYLEKSVESLKKKFARDVALHRADNMRIMQDNMTLIKEINELRQDTQNMRQSQHEQTMQGLGTRRTKLNADENNGMDPGMLVNQNRDQIKEMRSLIAHMEEQLLANRPVSREVLPPMEGFDSNQGGYGGEQKEVESGRA